MRTTITVDDELLAKAKDYTGIEETSAILRKGLEALVQREAAHRLIRLGGSEPGLEYVPRRRPPNFINDESDYPDQGRKRAGT
jgi:Arc/MetJ family transcription regulator